MKTASQLAFLLSDLCVCWCPLCVVSLLKTVWGSKPESSETSVLPGEHVTSACTHVSDILSHHLEAHRSLVYLTLVSPETKRLNCDGQVVQCSLDALKTDRQAAGESSHDLMEQCTRARGSASDGTSRVTVVSHLTFVFEWCCCNRVSNLIFVVSDVTSSSSQQNLRIRSFVDPLLLMLSEVIRACPWQHFYFWIQTNLSQHTSVGSFFSHDSAYCLLQCPKSLTCLRSKAYRFTRFFLQGVMTPALMSVESGF